MYKAYNRSDIIKNIQIHLEKVRQNGKYIAPSGIYDNDTRMAVSDFQQRVGIAPNGIVDAATIDLLYKEYIKQSLDNIPSYKVGDRNNDMLFINQALRDLMDFYGETHYLQVNTFFSSETERAIKILSNKYMKEYHGYLDGEFYSILIRDHNSI
jgi:peptidoglycan hydrolase-like protein with peptidoglycan-binding domain